MQRRADRRVGLVTRSAWDFVPILFLCDGMQPTFRKTGKLHILIKCSQNGREVPNLGEISDDGILHILYEP